MKTIAHVTQSFAPGGAQVRMVQLMNAFGREFRHVVLVMTDEVSAAERVDASVPLEIRTGFTDPNPWRCSRALAAVLRREPHDLVLTYNFGGIDGIAAAWMAGIPCIHAEDGFGKDEAVRQKPVRVWFRRLVLKTVRYAVAPSRLLARIMRETWWMPEAKIRYIANGIDVSPFQPREHKQQDRIVLGTAGHLRPEKQQESMIRAFAEASRRDPRLELRIAGEGSSRPDLEAAIRETGMTGRVQLLGYTSNIQKFFAELDVFLLSSATEQMPMSVLEAMASGLPVISTDVGDIRNMVAESNRPYLTPGAGPEMTKAIEDLAADAGLRASIGEENRRRVESEYGLDRMIAQYRDLYRSAIT